MHTINTSIAYLIGLITGKGYIEGDNKISIEFPFVNEFVEGIAHCPQCGYLATKPSGSEYLQCKNSTCANSKSACIDPEIKKKYNQPIAFNSSIQDTIIPFLKQGINFDYNLVSNSTCTFLTITLEPDLYSYLKSLFHPAISFTSTSIPKEMWHVKPEEKNEVINGLLDSIGFANAGGWIPRDGKAGHGRMRVYFQIINRNYKLPVSIDNYIRDNFNLPIQTIDWGHPNIRDGNLVDYLEGKSSAYGREHQVKFYPEYYQQFKFRISSKQDLFTELLQHNLSVGFSDSEDWFPNGVKEIAESKIKATHPMETNPLLDKKVRTHVDALWQVNLKMGCTYVKSLQDKAADKELFAVTGISKSIPNAQEKIANFKKISDERSQKILSEAKTKKKTVKTESTGELEADTYPLLIKWLDNYISNKTSGKAFSFDTSSQTLFHFFSSKSDHIEILYDVFSDLESLAIRPDVVGFSESDKDFYFIESKITSLGLKELGQLMGYCHVANPKEAFLVTTKSISTPLMKAIQRNREIIKYGDGKEVQFGKLKGPELELIKL